VYVEIAEKNGIVRAIGLIVALILHVFVINAFKRISLLMKKAWNLIKPVFPNYLKSGGLLNEFMVLL